MNQNNEKDKLPITEELDFHYLLQLMGPLHNQPGFAWLPELFVLVGHRALINLCKYAGGETITIPTLDELADSIEALQWYYDVYISKKRKEEEVPNNLHKLFYTIREVYRDA